MLGLGEENNPVQLAFWNNDGIYSQTTEGADWAHGAQSVYTPGSRLLYSATESFKNSTSEAFQGKWFLSSVA